MSNSVEKTRSDNSLGRSDVKNNIEHNTKKISMSPLNSFLEDFGFISGIPGAAPGNLE